MLLRELLTTSGVLVEMAEGSDLQREITAIAVDSRLAVPGCLFIARRGSQRDGGDFVQNALDNGAVAVLLDGVPAVGLQSRPDVVVLLVSDARMAVGPLASAWFKQPSRQLKVLGVTGTNGKTTTCVLAAQLLNAAGHRAAAIGTLGVWTAQGVRPGTMTTPDALDLQRLLAELLGQGFSHVCLEVSSHALEQGRVEGVQFATAAWTNLSRDHLDYHLTMAAYATAKSKLFRQLLKTGTPAFVNADDDFAGQIWQEGRAQGWSMGQHPAAEHQLLGLKATAQGITFSLASKNRPDLTLQCPLIGMHNAENLVAAVLTCRALGVTDEVLAGATPTLRAPRGRLEPVANDLGALVTVDYAHTPDALAKVLATLRPLVGQGRRLIALFGCGGDRDRGKRAEMGRCAATLADLVIVTSDNPRGEVALRIIEEIEPGLKAVGALRLDKLVPSELKKLASRTGYLCEVDREQAIRRAIHVLSAGDVLVIAGKGHETTQTIADQVLPFDDAEVAARWLQLHRQPQNATAIGSGYAFDGAMALAACGGKLLARGERLSTELCTDSRDQKKGSLFVALQGERFDGNDFIAQALQSGAAGVICTRGEAFAAAAKAAGAFLLQVPDTLLALQELTHAYRLRFSPLTIGITGSNGKTTTKELTGLALSPMGEVLITAGNFNNRIGVPLTIARMTQTQRAAVIEMGMSEPGEIARLTYMALPQLAVITSVGEAHLLGMGSLEAIIQEKFELARALPPHGTAILPADVPRLRELAATLPCHVLWFGKDPTADVRLRGEVRVDGLTQNFDVDVCGKIVSVQLPGIGVHLAQNTLAALAVAHVAGVDVHAAARELSRYVPVGQRMLPSKIGNWLVLEDCYNANPGSTRSALETLANLPHPQIALLGSMLELGVTEKALHRQMGEYASKLGIDRLIGVGDFAADYARGAGSIAATAENPNDAAALVAAAFKSGGTILVKGSRGAKMERAVAALRAAVDTQNAPTTNAGRS